MDNTNELHTAEFELLSFEPIILIRDVAKRWLQILLIALLVGVATYIYTDMNYSPVYVTNTTFVVTTRGSSSSIYSNLSSTSSLANVFTELLNSSILRKTILEETQMSAFDGTVETSVVPETNLVTMKVTASDPRSAFLMAQGIIDHHESLTYQVVQGISLEVLQGPQVPSGPANYANSMQSMEDMMKLAAVAACVLMLWSCYSSDMVRSTKEARNKLDCDCLGEIPHENKYKTTLSWLRRRKTSILITNPATSFRFVEPVRKLRRRVEQHMRGGKVLMVTSLLENEGKSTVAVNLALSMAKKHKRVLLMECDLRKPACHALLEQWSFSGGVKDVLAGRSSVAESIIRYKKTHLYLLLEKKPDRNSGDLITSEEMQGLLNWARKEFDFVVLDLPPMSVVSDAEAMADYADGSLLVVRQDMAPAAAINRVIAALEGANAKLLGCVLNNVYSGPFSVKRSSNSYGRYRYGSGK